jgi:hypothetical protein
MQAAVHYGPKGVALTYSLLMALWLFPTILWARRDTVVSPSDILFAVRSPLVSGIVAGGLAFAVRSLYVGALPNWPRLIVEWTICSSQDKGSSIRTSFAH